MKEIAAEVIPAGAAESLAAPDGADGVLAAIAFLHDGTQLAAQRVRIPQCLFHERGFLIAESVIQVAVQELGGDLRCHWYCHEKPLSRRSFYWNMAAEHRQHAPSSTSPWV